MPNQPFHYDAWKRKEQPQLNDRINQKKPDEIRRQFARGLEEAMKNVPQDTPYKKLSPQEIVDGLSHALEVWKAEAQMIKQYTGKSGVTIEDIKIYRQQKGDELLARQLQAEEYAEPFSENHDLVQDFENYLAHPELYDKDKKIQVLMLENNKGQEKYEALPESYEKAAKTCKEELGKFKSDLEAFADTLLTYKNEFDPFVSLEKDEEKAKKAITVMESYIKPIEDFENLYSGAAELIRRRERETRGKEDTLQKLPEIYKKVVEHLVIHGEEEDFSHQGFLTRCRSLKTPQKLSAEVITHPAGVRMSIDRCQGKVKALAGLFNALTNLYIDGK